jgi:hypothetical protein
MQGGGFGAVALESSAKEDYDVESRSCQTAPSQLLGVPPCISAPMNFTMLYSDI